MLNTQEIVLNVDKSSSEVFYAKQCDNESRIIKVKLFSNGKQVRTAKEENVLFRFVKPDGKSGINPAQIEADGTINITLTDQVLACEGMVYCDVCIVNGETIISTSKFTIIVDPIPVSENQLASSNEFLALNEISVKADKSVEQINKLLPQTSKAITDAQKAASDALNAALKAEDAAKKIEVIPTTNIFTENKVNLINNEDGFINDKGNIDRSNINLGHIFVPIQKGDRLSYFTTLPVSGGFFDKAMNWLNAAKSIKFEGIIEDERVGYFGLNISREAISREYLIVNKNYLNDIAQLMETDNILLKLINKKNTGLLPIYSITQKVILSERNIHIKLIGDSITAGMGGSGYETDENLFNPNGNCWANSLRDYLQSKYNCTVKNCGIAGLRSDRLISKLGQLIEGDDDIIICMIGTNDRTPYEAENINTPEEIRKHLSENLLTIEKYVADLGKDIIFMSSIPTTPENEVKADYIIHMEDIDAVTMSACTKMGREYISNYKEMMRYCKYTGVALKSLLADDIHPNDLGYKVMFNIISNSLGFPPKTDSYLE